MDMVRPDFGGFAVKMLQCEDASQLQPTIKKTEIEELTKEDRVVVLIWTSLILLMKARKEKTLKHLFPETNAKTHILPFPFYALFSL